MRRNSSQENEIRNMPESRVNRNFSGDIETLTIETNLWISQEISLLLKGVNSQMESNISTAISERVIPQMQGVVETMLARQLESIPGTCRRPHNPENDVRSLNQNNLTNSSSHFHQNLLEPGDKSPYDLSAITCTLCRIESKASNCDH